jgi:hypothetical protein
VQPFIHHQYQALGIRQASILGTEELGEEPALPQETVMQEMVPQEMVLQEEVPQNKALQEKVL